MTRPVILQINKSGAWHDVLHFDFDDLKNQSGFLDAAAKIAHILGSDETTLRIVDAVMLWNAKGGWKKAGTP